jgi:hypothetical protein
VPEGRRDTHARCLGQAARALVRSALLLTPRGTMSKSSTPKSTRTSQSFLASKTITALERVEADLKLPEALDPVVRRTLGAQSGRIPDALIEAMAAMVTRHHGVVCGMKFDADAARETIASVAASTAVLATLDRISQRLRDQVLRKRAAVAAEVETRYLMLQRLARGTEGAAVREEAAAMHAILRKRQPRRAKKAVAPIAPPTVPELPAEPTLTLKKAS